MTPPSQADELTGSKAKLVMVTIDLMGSKGFENTSVQDILDAAQVTKSNFYYHFKSKEDLCLTALEMMENYFFTHMLEPTLLNEELSPKERFMAFFNTQFAKLEDNCEHGCPFSNLASETSDLYPVFQQRLSQFYQRQIRLIEKCFEEGVEKGEFRSDIASSQIAPMLLSVMSGAIFLAKVSRDPNVIRQNIELIFQFIDKT